MTERKKSTLRTRTTVPVSSRTAQRNADRAPRPRARLHQRFDLISIGVMVSVVLVILVSVAVPLRNYYEGRAEIARLEDSIAAKQAEKQQLSEEIERYHDEDFVREQARRRFGLVAPGETAYRILDPRITNNDSVTTSRQDYEEARSWYEVLWDAITEPPEPPVPATPAQPAEPVEEPAGEHPDGEPAPEVPDAPAAP
ncbi:septum formation initiator family protein [Corynebacterium sp. MNWGS58]|uniref:septum formation initiator family protein n=1 Tax=Corynebacterium sp. 102791.4 TaxID=3104612 RepID=UPI00351769B1